jgi:hypothetical protein
MSLWRAVHPSLRVGAVMGTLALTLLAVKGPPPFWTAVARAGTAPAASTAAAPCADCRAGPEPFRMLPSDLAPGGMSQHVPSKGPFLGIRAGAGS